MPIYEYTCRACGAKFEALVRGADVPGCPSCESEDLERLLSLPAVTSDSTRAAAMRSAKQRDAVQARDRVETQRAYERNHD